jgi:hypothetical protein
MLGHITLDPEATAEQTAWDKAYNKLNLRVGLILGLHSLVLLFLIAWSIYESRLPEYFANGKVIDADTHSMKVIVISTIAFLYNLAVGIPFYIFAKRAERNLGARPEAAKV